jgi:hypothetical protein
MLEVLRSWSRQGNQRIGGDACACRAVHRGCHCADNHVIDALGLQHRDRARKESHRLARTPWFSRRFRALAPLACGCLQRRHELTILAKGNQVPFRCQLRDRRGHCLPRGVYHRRLHDSATASSHDPPWAEAARSFPSSGPRVHWAVTGSLLTTSSRPPRTLEARSTREALAPAGDPAILASFPRTKGRGSILVTFGPEKIMLNVESGRIGGELARPKAEDLPSKHDRTIPIRGGSITRRARPLCAAATQQPRWRFLRQVYGEAGNVNERSAVSR